MFCRSAAVGRAQCLKTFSSLILLTFVTLKLLQTVSVYFNVTRKNYRKKQFLAKLKHSETLEQNNFINNIMNCTFTLVIFTKSDKERTTIRRCSLWSDSTNRVLTLVERSFAFLFSRSFNVMKNEFLFGKLDLPEEIETAGSQMCVCVCVWICVAAWEHRYIFSQTKTVVPSHRRVFVCSTVFQCLFELTYYHPDANTPMFS